MAVSIDVSTAFLRPSQLAALATAVRDAQDDDEHDWLEWKSDLDLKSKEAKEHIAKQVLGMSNRTVAAASRHAHGHGYMLVGVQPGSIVGVGTIDNADLTAGISRYVGAVQWTPEYVSVDGKTVLVVIVEPPRPGDTIFCLQKGFRNHQAGAVFVRVPGRTEQATPTQVDALVERARAGRETLDLVVRAEPATIETGLNVDEDRLAEILDAERELLMRPERSRRHEPAKQTDTPFGPTASLTSPFASMARPQFKPDKRTEEQYVEEVENYLDQLRNVLVVRLLHRRLHHRGSALCLMIDNPTDRNFSGLQVTVHVAGNVRRWPDDLEDEVTYLREFPERPHKLGTPTSVPNFLDNLVHRTAPVLPPIDYSSFNFSSPGFSVEDTGSVTISFDPVHLRPQTPKQLCAVELIVEEPVGTELLIEWKATAENVDGLMTGSQTIVVVVPTVEYDNLPDDD